MDELKTEAAALLLRGRSDTAVASGSPSDDGPRITIAIPGAKDQRRMALASSFSCSTNFRSKNPRAVACSGPRTGSPVGGVAKRTRVPSAPSSGVG